MVKNRPGVERFRSIASKRVDVAEVQMAAERSEVDQLRAGERRGKVDSRAERKGWQKFVGEALL